MNPLRERRRVALQVLYQLDNGGLPDDPKTLRDSIQESMETMDVDEETIEQGITLANEAWTHRDDADSAIEPLTPEWPIRRQPVIDRNVLRLAWYEMMIAGTPPKVVISESVELAREYSTDQSSSFVNGVLDQLFNNLKNTPAPDAQT
ncbi:MAG: transcription antitermination factor NusB [Phycisphaerales bacterium]|nr:transcription antitermination factor NusB [Phycisphaerales bacterium]